MARLGLQTLATAELDFSNVLSAKIVLMSALGRKRVFRAPAGNVLGSVVNWMLGRMIERFRDCRWFPVDERALERAERWCGRWGKWSLLRSWAIVGIANGDRGGLRTPFATFLALILIAKAGRYGLIVLAVMGTLGV